MKQLFVVILALLFSQATYSDSVMDRFPEMDKRCSDPKNSPILNEGELDCRYSFGEVLGIQIIKMDFQDETHVNVEYLKNDDYEVDVGMTSGCVTIIRRIHIGKSIVRDYLYISTRTGAAFLHHKQCSED